MTPEEVSGAVARVVDNKDRWADLPDKAKLDYLLRARDKLEEVAPAWAAACNASRHIDTEKYPHLYATGWLMGPGGTGIYLNTLITVYESLVQTGKPPKGTERKVGDQIVVKVYPMSFRDQLALPSTAELWLQPGKPATQGACRQRRGVCCILGAGNYEIPIDILTKMFAESKVVAYCRHGNLAGSNLFLQQVFAELVSDGYLSLIDPGVALADQVVRDERVDEVLLTGGVATYDKIVWGDAEAKQAGRLRVNKPVEAELGAVSPYILAPGPWTDKELDHHARALVGFKMMNSSAICASPQLLITQRGWAQHDAFLSRVRHHLEQSRPMPIFYNGTQERCDAAAAAYPGRAISVNAPGGAGDVRPVILTLGQEDIGSFSCRNEAFAPVIADLTLEAANATEFLHKVRDLANSDEVFGSLSCSVFVHPTTEKEFGGAAALDTWLQGMEWGTTSVNDWGGSGTFFPTGLWGAYPKHRPEDIQSGTGIIGNFLMYDFPQKQVIRSPFNSPAHPKGVPSVKDADMFRSLANYAMRPGWGRLGKMMYSAVRAMM
eukprot:TRINITY_DN50305_c0_g1_i1.p1 TRINITY_DN50305_c0_g1~~TRINITY_DN50305_c0_g1_i1.p1  ORF type:complete len:575 (+),score=172.28 TRINITY_DN50305_c0_g1_i1:81-1727(+)